MVNGGSCRLGDEMENKDRIIRDMELWVVPETDGIRPPAPEVPRPTSTPIIIFERAKAWIQKKTKG